MYLYVTELVHAYTSCIQTNMAAAGVVAYCSICPLPLYPPHYSRALSSDGWEHYLATHSSPHRCL